MTKKILIGAVGALLLGPTAALAADLPAKAAPPVAQIYNWTGFYIGVQGGGSAGGSDHVARVSDLSFANGYNIKGGFGGGTIGYNWQMSNFVLGFEGDGAWGSEYGSNTDNGTIGNPAFLSFTKETWLATARLRLGYAVNNLLFYGTGGFAATGIEFGVKDANTLALLASGSSTRTGWTAGGGVEWGFAPNWSAKFELLYAQFGDATFNTVAAEGPRNVPLVDTVARAGINYRFGGPAIARY
ncbi:outer membrane beta-barrel protein [Bradyrhizobium sp.]|uniref:outer membrane protein n=1 Tax=Bradyrhizobium sp. TaxID=376 RepID=UPI0026020ABB|nr:outer membrane beta-barrel protein [Bradyrhizobium sp.]